MLIRIRTPENETIRLQVDSSTNFSDLLAQAAAAASCSLDAASLSLNGTNAIVAAPNASVAEAGLAQGDLIYLLDRDEGDETATTSPSDTCRAPPIAATCIGLQVICIASSLYLGILLIPDTSWHNFLR